MMFDFVLFRRSTVRPGAWSAVVWPRFAHVRRLAELILRRGMNASLHAPSTGHGLQAREKKKTRDSKIGQSKIVLSDWIRQGGPGRAPRWAALQCWATILRDPWSLWINGQPQVERKDLRTVRENEFDRRSENLKDGYRFRSAIRRFQVNYAFGMFDHHNSRWGEGTDADKETKKSEAAYLVDPLSWRGRKDPGRM